FCVPTTPERVSDVFSSTDPLSEFPPKSLQSLRRNSPHHYNSSQNQMKNYYRHTQALHLRNLSELNEQLQIKEADLSELTSKWYKSNISSNHSNVGDFVEGFGEDLGGNSEPALFQLYSSLYPASINGI
ncbi:5071_t:CDS:1, partial [Acaulospora morrowiae]